jgi:hypothetical protein
VRVLLAVLTCGALALARADAQAQHHSGNTTNRGHDSLPADARPRLAGQDAYAAIAEIVAILEADSSTDWSRVDLEGLRQHLIDMNDVTLRASVAQRAVPGGLEMSATGDGRTAAAIRRMVRAHAAELESSPLYRASAEEIPQGIRLTVTARAPSDARLVARIRGLGFIGLMTSESHHAAHHLMLARGQH